MDQSTFIGGLQDTKTELRSACRSLETLRRKMVGPRPEDSQGEKSPPSEPNVAMLISDVRALAIEVGKRIEEHLNIVGSDQLQPAKTATGY